MAPKTPRLEYSPHKRTRIKVAHELGLSAPQIANLEGVPACSVYGIVGRYRVQKSAQSSPRAGRPPLLSNRDKRHIFQVIRNDPNADIITKAGLTCSIRTLTRFLTKEGIQHSQALLRPKLTPEVALKRLNFAKDYLSKSPAFWQRWIFSDETTIARGCGEKRKWVFCRRGERLLPHNVQPKSKPTRHSQMFWAGFSYNRPQRILECLQENLPTIAEPGFTFAQDNASTHTAGIVQEWLGNWIEENGIQEVEWPPYSPDLNPIENLWKVVKDDIMRLHPELSDMPKNNRSKQKLCEAAVEAWENLDDEMLNNLITTMPQRMQAVVAAGGWYTKY